MGLLTNQFEGIRERTESYSPPGSMERSLTVMEKIVGGPGFTENIRELSFEHVKYEMLIRIQVEMLGRLLDI